MTLYEETAKSQPNDAVASQHDHRSEPVSTDASKPDEVVPSKGDESPSGGRMLAVRNTQTAILVPGGSPLSRSGDLDAEIEGIRDDWERLDQRNVEDHLALGRRLRTARDLYNEKYGKGRGKRNPEGILPFPAFMAKKLNRSESYVEKMIRLADLDAASKEMVTERPALASNFTALLALAQQTNVEQRHAAIETFDKEGSKGFLAVLKPARSPKAPRVAAPVSETSPKGPVVLELPPPPTASAKVPDTTEPVSEDTPTKAPVVLEQPPSSTSTVEVSNTTEPVSEDTPPTPPATTVAPQPSTSPAEVPDKGELELENKDKTSLDALPVGEAALPKQPGSNEATPMGSPEDELRQAVDGLDSAYQKVLAAVSHVFPLRVSKRVGEWLAAVDANDATRHNKLCDALREEEKGAIQLDDILALLPDTDRGKNYRRDWEARRTRAVEPLDDKWLTTKASKALEEKQRAAKQVANKPENEPPPAL